MVVEIDVKIGVTESDIPFRYLFEARGARFGEPNDDSFNFSRVCFFLTFGARQSADRPNLSQPQKTFPQYGSPDLPQHWRHIAFSCSTTLKTMADEDDDVISIEELILDLASSRTDGIPVRTRNDLIQQATGRLGESADDRRDLAGLDGTSDRRTVGISTQYMIPHIFLESIPLVYFNLYLFFRTQMLDQVRLSTNSRLVLHCH